MTWSITCAAHLCEQVACLAGMDLPARMLQQWVLLRSNGQRVEAWEGTGEVCV